MSMATSTGRARASEPAWVTVISDDQATRRPDHVVGEEPLEIRVQSRDAEADVLGVTMRTPGNDFELAVGFLLSEGVLTRQEDVLSVRYCQLSEGTPQQYNQVTVACVCPVELKGRRRTSTVTSSCGICGTSSLEQLEGRCPRPQTDQQIDARILVGLPDLLRPRQRVFERTGGLHAAGLFDYAGEVVATREDVGRHNAVDKLIGWAALERRLPLSAIALVVSGRVSFEIVQKAAVAGISTVVAVSAPTSLAVLTAQRLGMTLVAFVRGGRANVYAGVERVRTNVEGGGVEVKNS